MTRRAPRPAVNERAGQLPKWLVQLKSPGELLILRGRLQLVVVFDYIRAWYRGYHFSVRKVELGLTLMEPRTFFFGGQNSAALFRSPK